MKSVVFALAAVVLNAPAWAEPAKSARPKPPDAVSVEPFSVSTAAPRNVRELIAHFQEIDNRLKSLSARFTQSLTMADAGMAQRVDGTLEYEKPNRLRVEHMRPLRQVFVTDGSKVWVHRVDQNQVIESSLADWRKSDPLLNNLLDLGSYSKLMATYDVAFDTASLRVTLTPKTKPQTPYALKLTLSGAWHFPAETELDVGATTVRTELRDLRFNPAIPDSRFRFVVPPGADVFDNFKLPTKAQETSP